MSLITDLRNGRAYHRYAHLAIRDRDPKVSYTPVISPDGMPGYRCDHVDGRREFIYFNPSDVTDGSDVSNVFVYQGPHFDPAADGTGVHFLVLEDAGVSSDPAQGDGR